MVAVSLAMVMPSMPGAPLLSWTCSSAFNILLRSTTASIDGPATAEPSRPAFAARIFGLSGGGIAGFTRRSGSQVQLHLILLPHRSARNLPLYWPLPPFGPSADRSTYYALC